MAVNTPILGLRKPVANVEENWAFRLNENADILDQTLLVGNVDDVANVTTFNDGVGHLLVSGSTNPVFEHVEAITFNSDYVTVATGTFSGRVSVGGTAITSSDIITTSGIFDELFVNGADITATATDQSFKYLLNVVDTKASNIAGGTFTSGAWRVRDLNSLRQNNLPGATFNGSNTVFLPEGDYYIEWSAPAFDSSRHQSILYNTTGAYTVLQGSSEFNDTTDPSSTNSVGRGYFTLGSDSSVQIWHRCESTKATNGFGVESNFGVNTIYTQVSIWRMDADVTNLIHVLAPSGTFADELTVSGVPVTIGSHTAIPDPLVLNSGIFNEELTISGVPVTAGLGDPLTVTSGTFTTGLNVPHGPTTSGNMAGDFWIDPTTSGLRWEFNGVVFEAQGIEVV